MICLMFWISALPVIWAMLASRTFSSLPLHSQALLTDLMLDKPRHSLILCKHIKGVAEHAA